MAAGESLLPPVAKPVAPPLVQQIYQCFSIGALALASYFVISHFVMQTVQVVGQSMVPTLQDSQQLLLNRWIYLVRAPQRCDVVVLRDNDNNVAVKRIIGMPGDVVELKDGKVYINTNLLSEPYLNPGTPTFPYTKEPELDKPIKCEKDEYYVLGDNRKNSADSRTYGKITRQQILGLISR